MPPQVQGGYSVRAQNNDILLPIRIDSSGCVNGIIPDFRANLDNQSVRYDVCNRITSGVINFRGKKDHLSRMEGVKAPLKGVEHVASGDRQDDFVVRV